MIKEIDLISRQFKSSTNTTVIRKDINLVTQDLKKETQKFMNELESQIAKQKAKNVILVGVIY